MSCQNDIYLIIMSLHITVDVPNWKYFVFDEAPDLSSVKMSLKQKTPRRNLSFFNVSFIYASFRPRIGGFVARDILLYSSVQQFKLVTFALVYIRIKTVPQIYI